jgi:ubiquinone/menaquinone biosynthesis C-methylase UbiE
MANQPGSSENVNTYVIDAESPAEMARLLDLHTLITKSMGGLFAERTDIAGVRDILDIACGPGGWVLDVAREYPDTQVTGIDISKRMVDYASAYALVRGLDNAHFLRMDALKPLDFSDASFDLVNGRALVGFMYPEAWTALLQETFRIIRPGGILRLNEGEMAITNSPAYEKLSGLVVKAIQLVNRSFSPDGRHFGITPMLSRLLREAGYQNIQQRPYIVDFSAGTESRDGWYQDFMIGFYLGSPFIIQMGLITKEDFESTYQQMLAEMLSDNFCGIAFGLTAWGQKP